MSSRRRAAFTLVELLVVIAIIGILMALLMPAVMRSRETARIVQCTNNQHQQATAIQQYEMAKKHLPGYVNLVSNTQESWVPVLFPFLGRVDLWEGPTGWRMGNGLVAAVPQVVCPDDARPAQACPLSYVVNAGVYGGQLTKGAYGTPLSNSWAPKSPAPASISDPVQDIPGIVLQPNATPTPPSPGCLGVFRNYANYAGTAADAPISFSDVRSHSQTVMLSEKVFVAATPRQWNETEATRDLAIARFGFSWPNYQPFPSPVEQPFSNDITPAATAPLPNTAVGMSYVFNKVNYWPPLPTIHPGIVVVTFCDGHTDSVADETLCSAYLATP